jgi:hypothetical protein
MQGVPYNFAPVELIQTYLKRARTSEENEKYSSIGRTSVGSGGGADTSLKYLMLDMLLNDVDFKNEVRLRFVSLSVCVCGFEFTK